MSEEIRNSNQSENYGTYLEYETPKLHKHGTMHDMTFNSASGDSGDGGDAPNTYANATPAS